MAGLNVAVVSRDDQVRLDAARAFDAAPPAWHVTLHRTTPKMADVILFGSDVAEEATPGALVFDPAEGEDLIERVKSLATAARSRTVVVTGAAGGVGATTVALHLSVVAARSHATCFVDLDVEGDAAVRLGIERDDFRTWADVGNEPDDLRLSALPVAGGFRALLAPRTASVVEPESLLTRLEDEFERVVIDCSDRRLGADLGSRSDVCVVVVRPTASCARRARRLLDESACRRVAVVVNRLGPGGEMTRTALQRILETKIAVELPCTPAVRDREDAGCLLSSPWTRFGRRIALLYRAIERS